AHLAFVVGMLNMDSQDRDAPRVNHAARINLGVIFKTREHRRARGQSDGRGIPPAHLSFEFAAETFGPARPAGKRADARSALATVAAQEFRMFRRIVQIAESRNEDTR